MPHVTVLKHGTSASWVTDAGDMNTLTDEHARGEPVISTAADRTFK